MPGMLLHIDGSKHRWFQDERWYDLIVILDDATSEPLGREMIPSGLLGPVRIYAIRPPGKRVRTSGS